MTDEQQQTIQKINEMIDEHISWTYDSFSCLVLDSAVWIEEDGLCTGEYHQTIAINDAARIIKKQINLKNFQ